MILQALVKYYEDLERQEKLPKQGWCQAKVSYGINLSTDGDIKNILCREETDLDFTNNESSGNAHAIIRSCGEFFM